MINQAGSTVGTMAFLAPLCISFILLCVSLLAYCRGVAIARTYTNYEKQTALSDLATKLLLVRDGNLLTGGTGSASGGGGSGEGGGGAFVTDEDVEQQQQRLESVLVKLVQELSQHVAHIHEMNVRQSTALGVEMKAVPPKSVISASSSSVSSSSSSHSPADSSSSSSNGAVNIRNPIARNSHNNNNNNNNNTASPLHSNHANSVTTAHSSSLAPTPITSLQDTSNDRNIDTDRERASSTSFFDCNGGGASMASPSVL